MMKYYLAIKKNEILLHAIVSVNPENVTPSERSQPQQTTYCVIPLVRKVQDRQIHRDSK